jgi:hypothetical protein
MPLNTIKQTIITDFHPPHYKTEVFYDDEFLVKDKSKFKDKLFNRISTY